MLTKEKLDLIKSHVSGKNGLTQDYVRELVEEVERLQAQADRVDLENRYLRTVIKPFAMFAKVWNKKPIRGLHDDLYTIHNEASLKLSDCQSALKVYNREGVSHIGL